MVITIPLLCWLTVLMNLGWSTKIHPQILILPTMLPQHSVALNRNHGNLRVPELQGRMPSMMHLQKLTRLKLLMAMSPSVGSLSALSHTSHIISEMMMTLKLNLLLQTKVWAPWRKYGATPILICTANTYYSEQFLWTFSFGDVRTGHFDKPFFGNLKYSSILASNKFSTFP